MTWTGIARREHNRDGLRYPSDMTDREWSLAAPLVPPAKTGGRRRTTDMREVVNALLYIASAGCAWRLLPKCFPPVSTVRRYFYAWRNARLFESINTVLVMNLREIEGREASPSAGVIDSQSVKTTKSGGPLGYDAGKKVKGRKRHILTDTCGFLVFIAVDVLAVVRQRFPWLRHIFADGGYAGDKLRNALVDMGKWTIEVLDDAHDGLLADQLASLCGPASKIVVTRRNVTPGAYVVPMMDKRRAREVLGKNLPSPPSEEVFKTIWAAVGGHPLSLRLINSAVQAGVLFDDIAEDCASIPKLTDDGHNLADRSLGRLRPFLEIELSVFLWAGQRAHAGQYDAALEVVFQ